MSEGEVVQLGSGRDIYDSPATSFVAAFVGDPLLIKGIVHRKLGYPAFESGRLVARVRPDTREGAATLVLRPEQVRLVPDIAASSSWDNVFPGSVSFAAFDGTGLFAQIRLDCGVDVTVHAAIRDNVTASIDDRVAVAWNAEDAIVLEDTHSDATSDAGVAARDVGVRWRLIDALITLRRSPVARPLARLRPLLLLMPGLALIAVLGVGLGGLVWSSLHRFDTFLAVQGRFSFTQYSQALSDPQFKTVFVRTISMAALTAVVSVALALPFSLALARAKSRTKRLTLMLIIFVPYLTGDITRTFGWLATLGPNGPAAWIASGLGMTLPPLIGTLWAVGLGTVQVLIPAAVVILLPAVLRLDPELEEASSTLGARPYRTSFRSRSPSSASRASAR